MKKLLILLPLLTWTLVSAAQKGPHWKFETSGRIYSTPFIDGDRLFIGSGDSIFYALDKTNGKKIWQYKTNGANHSSACVYGDLVLFGSGDGSLYALDKTNGNPVWKFSSEGEKMLDLWDYYQSSPVVAGELVYWGCGDGTMYALNAGTGELNWKFKTGGIVHADALVKDSMVYFGSFDGTFYALSASRGKVVWTFKTVGDTYFPQGEIQKAAILDEGVLFFGSRDYNIYAIDAITGRGRWNMKEQGSWVIATPLSYKGNIYFGTSDTHRFYCMRKTDGKVLWSVQMNMRIYGSAVAKNDVVYTGCFNGKLYGLDYASGKILSEFQTDGCKANYNSVYNEKDEFRNDFELYGRDYIQAEKRIHTLGSILSTPVIDGTMIYFGSSDGAIYALNLD